MENDSVEKPKNIAIFFVIGFIVYFEQLTVISAAQDILTGTFIPTSVILIAITGPGSLITLIGPFCFQKVSYRVWICFIVSSLIGGNLVLVFTVHPIERIVGVCLISAGLGLSDMCFPSMTAFFHHKTISAFAIGTAFGYVLASSYNFGLSVLAGVPPLTTLYTVAPLPLIILVCYFFLDKPFVQEHVAKSITKQKAKYSPLAQSLSQEGYRKSLSVRKKLSATWESAPLLTSLFISIFCEYLAMQALVTTLAFPDAPFKPRDHYVAYVMCFSVGNLMGCCYHFCLSLCITESKTNTRQTLVFVLLQIVFTFSFCFAAWYRFVQSIIVVLIAIFLAGFSAGAIYTNVLRSVGEGKGKRVQEFCRALSSSMLPLPILIAGLLGLTTEIMLRKRCFQIETDVGDCFTRTVLR